MASVTLSTVPQCNFDDYTPPKWKQLGEAIRKSMPDDELVTLFDQLFPQQSSSSAPIEQVQEKENPLDWLRNYYLEFPEKAVRRIAEIYPVTLRHLSSAIELSCSEDVLLFLLTQALKTNPDLDTEKLIYWLFEKNFSGQCIGEFVKHAGELDDRYLTSALQKPNFPEDALSLILDKTIVVDTFQWHHHVLPTKNSAVTFYEAQVAEFKRLVKNDEHNVVPIGFDEFYWEQFKDKPKPYIPRVTPFSSEMIKKIALKYSQWPFLGECFGQVEESVIQGCTDASQGVLSFDVEHALLYGYSEPLILSLLEKVNVDEKRWLRNLIDLAELRGYSAVVLQKLEEMYPRSICQIL